jgi:hypothetical protein
LALCTLMPGSRFALAQELNTDELDAAGIELFENRIRPALVESCYACHSSAAGTTEGELSLENRAGVLRGGSSGPVIVPGDPDASRLMRAIEYHNAALQMPPDGKLPDEVIGAFREWIARGAPDPRDGEAAEVSTIAGRAAEHWAFQKPQRPEVAEDPTGWSTKNFDRLIAARLRSKGLAPTDEASREVRVRRLYFDLVGLAPTMEEIEAFKADSDPAAYEKLVDRLLNSPQFGERWARHWLDLARYSDTKGYVFTEDRNYPNAYKYRDWVITAINDDMPVDAFIKYQLAADRMVTGDADKHHLAAQGFVTLGRRFINNPHDIAADRIDVVFRGLMGLTVACARCHDHKYDPVSDEDYYAAYGILQSSREEQDETNPPRLVDKDAPENVQVFIRGSEHNRGEVVERGFPTFFTSFAPKVTQGSGRLELAEAIVHPENPLTARVYVNRVWGHLLGEQLVGTPSDFGLRCDAPLQQDVLDLLALEFAENGWSLKWLVRELVTSSTYRQSSTTTAEQLAADPENALWGRMNRRRLDFESLRDRLLASAGKLDTQVGGASQNIAGEDGGTRRTLYAHIDRQNLPNLFRTFDFASPDEHVAERPQTLVPQQALFLMNSPMVAEIAGSLVGSLSAADTDTRVTELYRKILGRTPTSNELEAARLFVSRGEAEKLAGDEWNFGYGGLVEGTVRFSPLPMFAENRWQSTSFPADDAMGYVSLTATGGHPGRSREHASIRRWTAPSAGQLIVEGLADRPESQGDGIEAMLVSSRRGVLESWVVEHGQLPTNARVGDVEPGEHIDFVVSCRENDGFDSYNWQATITLTTATERRVWHTTQGFRGPTGEPMQLWAQFAQALLMSNEFLYVD